MKIIILPSRVRFFRRHILKAFSMPIIVFFCSSSIVLLYETKIPSIFIAYLVKPIHLIPQTATFTPFSSPIQGNSHFDKFGFQLENNENKEIAFSNLTQFFKKKVVSSA